VISDGTNIFYLFIFNELQGAGEMNLNFSLKFADGFFNKHARKPQAFKPGDEWHPGAKRKPFIFLAKSSSL